MELKEKIIEKLKEVIDQETTLDVISMGLIKDLSVAEDAKVSLKIKPSSPVCPLIFSLAFDIKNSLKTLAEIKEIHMTVIDHQMANEVNKYLTEEEFQ